MLPAFTAIQDYYCRRFPNEVPIKAAQSFVASAVINLAVGYSMPVALTLGATAATATIIEAVIRPIIQDIFPDYPLVVQIIQGICPFFMALSLAHSVAPWLAESQSNRINRTHSFILSVFALLTLNNNPIARNVGMVKIFT